jgi:hypothetical protein
MTMVGSAKLDDFVRNHEFSVHLWEELEGRCRQAERVQESLGVPAYDELLSLFGVEEDRRETL